MSLKNQHHSNISFSLRETNMSGTTLVARSAPVRWQARMRGSNTSLILTPSPQPSPTRRGGKISFNNIARNQQGITLVGALFIIVVMALLGTGLLQLTATSQQSIGQEITSVKAYFAGHSALQWGMYQATFAGATGAHTLTFTQQGLTNTTVNSTLTSTKIAGSTYYQINADGLYGITTDPEFSRRQLNLRYRP